jgi:hypothetical protein
MAGHAYLLNSIKVPPFQTAPQAYARRTVGRGMEEDNLQYIDFSGIIRAF